MRLPKLIVFDLDDCLWTPEMHELYGLPSIPIQGLLIPDDPKQPLRGTIGLKVPNSHQVVELYPGARQTLYTLATDPRYSSVELAVASSSLEPSYSHACLEAIEILPGRTLRNLFAYDQIGRTGVLSPSKKAHFRELRRESGVAYEEMLFFDDCNWGDHVGDLEDMGVTGIRTPEGLRFDDFEKGLKLYEQQQEVFTECSSR